MPTKHRRYAITGTPPVQAALDELQGELGRDRLDLAELVILGAREKLTQLRKKESRRVRLRRRLAERIRAGQLPIDRTAAQEVRRAGWVRS